jgi:hypothetical protein
MSEDRLRLLLVELIKAGYYITIAQTVLWLLHAGRDGNMQEWLTRGLGGGHDSSPFWALMIVWLLFPVISILITFSNARAVRWAVLAYCAFGALASAADWIGDGNSAEVVETYQYPLKVAHGLAIALVLIAAIKWLRYPVRRSA